MANALDCPCSKQDPQLVKQAAQDFHNYMTKVSTERNLCYRLCIRAAAMALGMALGSTDGDEIAEAFVGSVHIVRDTFNSSDPQKRHIDGDIEVSETIDISKVLQ